MENLPKEIVYEILHHTNDTDLLHLCQVDKKFHELCKDQNFWKKRGLIKFGNHFTSLYEELKVYDYKKVYEIASSLLFMKGFLEKYKIKVNNILDVYHLHEINLSRNELKSIPKELGNLKNLKRLNLSYNELTRVPDEIGNLTNLQVLDLSGNQLTSLPDEIGNLRNLRELWISGNPLTSIPKEIIEKLANLKKLNFYNNKPTLLPSQYTLY